MFVVSFDYQTARTQVLYSAVSSSLLTKCQESLPKGTEGRRNLAKKGRKYPSKCKRLGTSDNLKAKNDRDRD